MRGSTTFLHFFCLTSTVQQCLLSICFDKGLDLYIIYETLSLCTIPLTLFLKSWHFQTLVESSKLKPKAFVFDSILFTHTVSVIRLLNQESTNNLTHLSPLLQSIFSISQHVACLFVIAIISLTFHVLTSHLCQKNKY